MPLYDYHCKPCDRLFESFRSVASQNEPAQCPACNSNAQVFLVMTGFARIDTRTRWRPASPAEQLAGASVRGPGVVARGGSRGAGRDTILHACSGSSCAYCS